MSMKILRLYRTPALTEAGKGMLLSKLKQRGIDALDVETEFCFNIGLTADLDKSGMSTLAWLLSETFEPDGFGDQPFLKGGDVIEVGPRMSFQTAWSTNAVSIAESCGISKIKRLERSRRYKFKGIDPAIVAPMLYDRMTECVYDSPLKTFDPGSKPEPVEIIPLIEKGRPALVALNKRMGLGLDEWDIDYYHDLFAKQLKRNPTNVECFDLSQSNSEHSRHWFFKGRLVIDGREAPESLIDIVARPYKLNPRNSVIAFKDNSSAIKGFNIMRIVPEKPGNPSAYMECRLDYNLIFTAETHNFPSGVAPFPGAETGGGGRIRDVQAVGRGGHVIAGTAGYCVGNLYIPGYELPWEDRNLDYPKDLASPLSIEIEASNGASDYGNKFGEPLIQGYTRSFSMRMADGERREWIKPIMFTGGVGQMDARHTEKSEPMPGMLVIKLGGPAYRIGMGGGAASSMLQGENIEELDFNAVQRGDAEMEQKVNRVIRACIEMAGDNPIISIHDQGAGGNCNVLKELVAPAGAKIEIRDILLGDETLSVLEIWGAEYQENNALLIKPGSSEIFKSLCEREKVPYSIVGIITGDGRIIVHDNIDDTTPVALDLSKVLAEMPRKTFNIDRVKPSLRPLDLPKDLKVSEALRRVLRLLSVGSKRFLTNKVDRSVTGLIASQQCLGGPHLTVGDVSVIAQTHFGITGCAISIGEQPIKGLINPSAMARLSVAEALTNIVWAKITDIEDIRCSGNWMWAAKLPGEGALIYDAAKAMSDFMADLGIAVDGGKDSLSMAAMNRKSGELVKAPGALVISAYAPCPDITKTITPDIKMPGKSVIIHVELNKAHMRRLGGTAIAQVYGQLGDESPDIEDASILKSAFKTAQGLIDNGLILAGHDISDGGLVTAALEMSFSGSCGMELDIKTTIDPIAELFSEEPGLLIECSPENESIVLSAFNKSGAPCRTIGRTTMDDRVFIGVGGQCVLDEKMTELREMWEETSYRLELLQANPECVSEERGAVKTRRSPEYKLGFTPAPMELKIKDRLKIAIVREEGSNGDREMASAFYAAGFEPFDVAMSDLVAGRASLSDMRGAAFVGGFSYADVMDSAKGWAGAIKFNPKARAEFERFFYERTDTFSLGICNGCQLAALLGIVPWRGIDMERQPRFIHNKSGRFESRFVNVRIEKSPAMMLSGMEGSVLGVWVAHGEGMAHFPDKAVYDEIIAKNLVPLRFVDDAGEATEVYPFNPNGSIDAIAGLTTPDGRHLALMPHPERTIMKWNWPWMPLDWRRDLKSSPWLRMFQNAREWCLRNPS